MFRVEKMGRKVGTLRGMTLDRFLVFYDPVLEFPTSLSAIDGRAIRTL
jgi:hypothetical protein